MSQQPPGLPHFSPAPVRPERIPGTAGPVSGASAKPLFHPASAMVLVGVDALWMLADWAALLWFISIPLSFLACSLPVFFIQKFIHREPFFRAAGVAVLCGVLAAMPCPVTGTIVGLAILAWGRGERR